MNRLPHHLLHSQLIMASSSQSTAQIAEPFGSNQFPEASCHPQIVVTTRGDMMKVRYMCWPLSISRPGPGSTLHDSFASIAISSPFGTEDQFRIVHDKHLAVYETGEIKKAYNDGEARTGKGKQVIRIPTTRPDRESRSARKPFRSPPIEVDRLMIRRWPFWRTADHCHLARQQCGLYLWYESRLSG
jgi:hypothetical protein